MFAAAKTCCLRLISLIYVLFEFNSVLTIQQASFRRDICGYTVALIDEIRQKHPKKETPETPEAIL